MIRIAEVIRIFLFYDPYPGEYKIMLNFSTCLLELNSSHPNLRFSYKPPVCFFNRYLIALCFLFKGWLLYVDSLLDCCVRYPLEK